MYLLSKSNYVQNENLFTNTTEDNMNSWLYFVSLPGLANVIAVWLRAGWNLGGVLYLT